ncbi:MAG TPA: MarR family winged helix-turn-helix transcriptional regulator [Burkholderiaceae bacterium]|nr:MarR family winged helix-turn-helix transcriptional regulator [Burkholderiaceae bacterium]
MPNPASLPPDSGPHALWRHAHLGRMLNLSEQRFTHRVRELVALNPQTPLTLTRLAERDQIGSAHLHLLQHLPAEGCRLTTLAQAVGMTKQAMAAAVSQCMAWGLVESHPDPDDGRARRIVYTPLGTTWLQVYRDAVNQAQAEFRDAVGDDVATVVLLGLETYGSGG